MTQCRYVVELKNSKFDPNTGQEVKGKRVKIAEIDIPRFCANITTTGYKSYKWVEILGDKAKYSLEQLNKMIATPDRPKTEVEKLQEQIEELKALLANNTDEIVEEVEADDEIAELREQYKELYGKPAGGRMSKETLIQKIEEKQ